MQIVAEGTTRHVKTANRTANLQAFVSDVIYSIIIAAEITLWIRAAPALLE